MVRRERPTVFFMQRRPRCERPDLPPTGRTSGLSTQLNGATSFAVVTCVPRSGSVSGFRGVGKWLVRGFTKRFRGNVSQGEGRRGEVRHAASRVPFLCGLTAPDGCVT